MTTVSPFASTWELRLQQIMLAVVRVVLAYLFFTQLWWKVPPSFGCPADFKFTTADASGKLQRTSGLCDWIGIESVWATRPHAVFAADLKAVGGPRIALDIDPLSQGNGAFIDAFVKPNIRWFGFVVWSMEAFIFVSLALGLFTRLGGLVAVVQSAQLWVGLAGISNPFEWEWAYNLMLFLSLLVFVCAPGRSFGLDGLLRLGLKASVERGSKLAMVLTWLT